MKFFNKKNIFFKTALIILPLSAGTIAFYKFLHYQVCQSSGIYVYNPQTDRQFVLDLFKKNWYWLVAESSINFSPERVLDLKASSERPEDINKVKNFIYKVNGKPVGYLAYYLKTFYKGFIYFIVIDAEYRQKGYARKLLEFAIDNLKKENVKSIELITRTNNVRAQTLYKSLGFKEMWRDDGFIKYEKELI
ncbi:GNAT family N-acetyltransferase [Candidatus Dependentiae bacterium]|nr:GNAT family N-acetyltransferase [Candidatus Dependentiae bacterium]